MNENELLRQMEKKSTLKPKNSFGSNELGKIINQNSDKDMLMNFVQVSKKCQLSAAIVESKSQMTSQHQTQTDTDSILQNQPTKKKRKERIQTKKLPSPIEIIMRVLKNKQYKQENEKVYLTGKDLDDDLDVYVKLQDIEKETIF